MHSFPKCKGVHNVLADQCIYSENNLLFAPSPVAGQSRAGERHEKFMQQVTQNKSCSFSFYLLKINIKKCKEWNHLKLFNKNVTRATGFPGDHYHQFSLHISIEICSLFFVICMFSAVMLHILELQGASMPFLHPRWRRPPHWVGLLAALVDAILCQCTERNTVSTNKRLPVFPLFLFETKGCHPS